MVDPNGNAAGATPGLHQTTYSYTDSYSTCGGSAPPTSPSQSDAYLTTITYPPTNGISHSVSYCYDYAKGLLLSSTDENQQPTIYTYSDVFDRLTTVVYPDGGQTNVSYNDSVPSITTCQLINGNANASCSSTNPPSGWKTSVSIMDGLAHVIHAQVVSDPDGPDFVDTSYDGLGNAWTQSNPYRSTASTTDGSTTHNYDALGRTTSVVQPDGSTISTNYSGKCTTVTDEAGQARTSCVDGLGRMTGVWEDPNGLNYETDYTYDAVGNLLSVKQKGRDSNSANWRLRSFLYDSLAKLTSATNPESGTITYNYDANGNIVTKTAPGPTQINYTYDALNRLTRKAYTGTVLQYGYDGNSLSGCGQSPPTINSPTNLVGRRSAMCAGLSGSSWSYDPMGRPLVESRTNTVPEPASCTGTGKYRVCHSAFNAPFTFNVGYTYNLDGSLNKLTYPSTDAVTYTVGDAGRPTQVSDSGVRPNPGNNFVTFSKTAANPVMYTPNGALASMTNGYTSAFAGIVTSNSYNNRLQPALLSAATSQPIFSLSYGFNPGSDNGNVAQIVNNLDSKRSVAFTYDSLNRISQANTVDKDSTTNPECWGEAYTIDAWGNLTNIGPPSGISSNCHGENVNHAPATHNQLTGIPYDIAGNVSTDGYGNPLTYDAENTLAKSGDVTYDYDADGVRTEKSSGPMYWPGPGGEVLAETDLSGNINEEYIYFNGARIARVDRPSGTVHYYFSNHLGSHTMVTSATGACEQDIDYFPYGGIVNDYCPTVAQHYKFTGKERDTESGLDMFGARYYGNSLGRFMTPDWATKPTDVPYANFGNPQSLNLYSYVQNNPTTMGDPDGHVAGADDLVEGAVVGLTIAVMATQAYYAMPPEQRNFGAALSGAASSVGSTIKSWFQSSDNSKTAPAPQSNPAPGTQTGSQPGQKDADFVVTPSGTAVATDPGRVRDSLANAPGVTTTPANSPSGETGTIQTGVKTPNGPVDVRTMDGSASHGPRTVITHPGTNSPKTPDGKATNDKNDNHIPNDHVRPQ
jgi:RHS repeat-associated protein